ncbi:hypothetical protein KYK30_30215 [Shinella yambaruensis]|uniref:Uncharacterized protein n=1 Tax=Shinella yambaruensis TaxID=415996 RepID=A0ABQ5ZB42_9HYPH|nr:hypothetical protein [Shinella yambaruensis]MCJ8028746.1 hypothetical protein [Shinella yambaruensis]MCU7983995.1 hypothetical protein [Shinella yambaruensis]GLR49883.1 hypothetical protein GCM10007923_10880 [Shinella yambaruensis]
MARFAPRLPLSSFAGPMPELNLSEAEWKELETLLEVEIPDTARSTLLQLVDVFFRRKRAEDNAETYTEALRAIERMEKQLAGFLTLIHEPGQSDADHKAMSDLEHALSSGDIPLSSARLSIRDSNTREEHAPMFPSTYTLTLDDASNVAIEIKVALNRVRKRYEEEIAAKAKNFVPGSAFSRFGLAVRKWADENDFPKALRDQTNRPNGTPLACFLFQLSRRFPEEFAAGFASADALGRKLDDDRRDEQKAAPSD